MSYINKIKKLKRNYFIIIAFIFFLNTIFINNLYAASFNISDIEVSEKFDLNFNKKKVYDKAFKAAFLQLVSMVTISNQTRKVEDTSISIIKSLIDSFNISDEKFLNDRYFAKFNVNFNKKNSLTFFELNNIFPSIPNKLDVLLIPILIDTDLKEVTMFNDNPIYKNWNKNNEKYNLLNYILPTEDIEDRNLLKNNFDLIENYNFEEIIKKYDLKNYIIMIVYKNQQNLKMLSKINLNNDYKIVNQDFKNLNLEEENNIDAFIKKVKINYEDSWKELNIVNTSIKLPLTISLSSKDNNKILLFEKTLNDLDLVYNFYILSFDSETIIYKIIYNGSYKKFISEINKKDLFIHKVNKNWEIK